MEGNILGVKLMIHDLKKTKIKNFCQFTFKRGRQIKQSLLTFRPIQFQIQVIVTVQETINRCRLVISDKSCLARTTQLRHGCVLYTAPTEGDV